MKTKDLWLSAIAGALLLGTNSANAYMCSDTDVGVRLTVTRTWTLEPANDCKTGQGNPKEADIDADYGATWTLAGRVNPPEEGGDQSAFLDVELLTGAWGGTDVSGTWSLTSAFWAMYREAVIAIHVGGNDQGVDDYAAFYIFPLGSRSGTWSYVQDPLAGAGGGLSNLAIFGRGPALCPPGSTDPRCFEKEVPEPGSLALLGIGLVGLGLARRRRVPLTG